MDIKTVRRRALLAAAIVIGIMATATPAYADATIRTCTITLLWGTSCTTGTVLPNSGTHSVNWEVDTVYCTAHWQVIDAQNGVQVGSGNVGQDERRSSTIVGLYSPVGYYLRVSNSCYATYGKISNP